MRKIKNIVSGNEISVEEVFKSGWQYKLIEEILEAGYESEKRLTALEKKQEEPKQDEPEIVYGSTVSVRDQKIKKLFDDLDKELSITHDGNANSRTHLFIVLEKYKEKLNKILEGERDGSNR